MYTLQPGDHVHWLEIPYCYSPLLPLLPSRHFGIILEVTPDSAGGRGMAIVGEDGQKRRVRIDTARLDPMPAK